MILNKKNLVHKQKYRVESKQMLMNIFKSNYNKENLYFYKIKIKFKKNKK